MDSIARATQWRLPVVENRERGGRYRELVLQAPQLAACLRAGQFVNVLCAEGDDPLLRRPFSVCRIDRAAGTISLLYEVVGKGTRRIAEWQPGDAADVLAPLGNWFEVPAGAGAVVLVGGGIGVAPLVALAEELAPSGRPLRALLGARTADMLLCEEEFQALGVPVAVATDDGSRGHAGFVHGLLAEMMAQQQFDTVCTCGPRPMMAAVSRVAQAAGVPCFVSMEVGMACGFGVCMGCAWRVRRPAAPPFLPPACGGAGGGERTDGTPLYRLVCNDGPVFDAAEIVWE